MKYTTYQKQALTVKEWNAFADAAYQSYTEECKQNGLEPQRRDNFNQFCTFSQKTGFVMPGKYPIYKRRRKDF